MTELQRKAMTMRMDGMSLEEIAQVMGCTRQNVFILLQKAKENLDKPEYKRGANSCVYPAIRSFMLENHVTVQWMADQIGIQNTHMVQILHGKLDIRLSTARKIAAVCGLPVDVAFDTENAKEA